MKSMQSFLKDIAEVRTGLTLRGQDASKQFDEEGLHLLKISDLTAGGAIHIELPQPLKVTESMEKFRVAPGDVVVANRGVRMTAALVDDRVAALAGNQVYIIRADRSKVLPEYLWWFLNRPSTQSFLKYRARGSYVKTIPIKLIREELPIPLPPLEIQQRISEFASLARREAELTEEIFILKSTYREALFTQMLNAPLNSPD